MKKHLKKILPVLFAVMMLTALFSVTASAATTPGKPTLVSAKSSVYNKTVITWKPTTNATHYRIYYKREGSSKWVKVKTVASTVTSYTHKYSAAIPFMVGEKLTYTVRAYNDQSQKWGGYNKTGLTVNTLPNPVVLASVAANADKTQATVTWNAAKGCNYYAIYRKTPATGWSKIGKVKSTQLSFTDISPVKNTTHIYTVRGYYSKTKVYGKYDKAGKSVYIGEVPSVSNVNAEAAIEADVTLTGSGTGYIAKLVLVTPTSGVSFGIQYDQYANAPYTGRSVALIENIKSNAPGQQEYVRPGGSNGFDMKLGQKYHLMLTLQKDGHGSVYVDNVKLGEFYNPELVNKYVDLRVEGAARLDGDSVNATFQNIKVKRGDKVLGLTSVRTHDFEELCPTIHCNVMPSSDTITISGKVAGLGINPATGKPHDWDSNFLGAARTIQFVF